MTFISNTLATSNPTDYVSSLWGISPILGILAVVITALVVLYRDERREKREVQKDLNDSHNQRRQEALDTLEVLKSLKQAWADLTTATSGGTASISAEVSAAHREVMQKLDHMMEIEALRGGKGK